MHKRQDAELVEEYKVEMNSNELTVNVKGFYAPYEQNFVTETMIYFCPKKQYINNIPHWANLKPPD